MLRRPFNRHTVPSPWQEMAQLHREVSRLFSDPFSLAGGRTAPAYPPMNVWANENGLVVTAELPGFDPEAIDISVVDDTLTVSGSRQPEELGDSESYRRRERNYGKFSRTFQLPFAVEVDNVEAAFENGLLNISLPRAELDKPKKITVKKAKNGGE